MTDEDVIRQAHDRAGVGNVNGPYTGRPGTKPFWEWRVARQHDAAALMELVRPWMGRRRQAEIDRVLSEWRAQPPAVIGRPRVRHEANTVAVRSSE
jgi:hypothetical protein